MLAATALLVAPIALWARYGDGNVVRTIAIATAATMMSAGLVYLVRRPRYPALDPAALVLPSAPVTARCQAQIRRSYPLPRPAARMRAGSPASTYRARPLRVSRPSRDVRCRTTARRTARRRTRP
jgi:hypothetical protein